MSTPTLDYQALNRHFADKSPWQAWLQQQGDSFTRAALCRRHGDATRWFSAIDALDKMPTGQLSCDGSAICSTPTCAIDSSAMHDTLMALHPWRKGPFHLHGVAIDTEWRSDWKWQRLTTAIEHWQGLRVLDIGCGSGYHAWRAHLAGAQFVLGIEPSALFLLQFLAVKTLAGHPEGIFQLPVPLEHIPCDRSFDLALSMGVIYHRRSPFEHLQAVFDQIRPGGQAVIESLVVEGDAHTCLLPAGRYARMRNVWLLPSSAALAHWMRRIGFVDVEVIDEGQTSTQEQRQTPWMRFESLQASLDPDNPQRTVEGLPAPRRAMLIGRRPER